VYPSVWHRHAPGTRSNGGHAPARDVVRGLHWNDQA